MIVSSAKVITISHKLLVKITNNEVRLNRSNTRPRNSWYRYFGSNRKFECSVGNLFEKWKREFEEKSISEPEESITNILAHCLKSTNLSIVHKLRDEMLSYETVEEVNSLCERRLKRMPVQYVIGEWQFRTLTLKMTPPVFIPRPETEELVDIVLKEIDRNRSTKILDLCCGSGAIALALLDERHPLKATAVDQSEAACALTMENAQKLGLKNRIRIIHSQVKPGLIKEKFNVIISNPPYIFNEDMKTLQPEIKLFEDLHALDGGDDGLDVIKLILELSSEILNEEGKLFLEVDPRHPPLLRNLIKNNALGLSYSRAYRDISGKERFVEIIKK